MILQVLHSVLQSLTNFNEDFTSSRVSCTIRYLGPKLPFQSGQKRQKNTKMVLFSRPMSTFQLAISYKLILWPLRSSFALCSVQGCKDDGLQKVTDVTSYKVSKSSEQWPLSLLAGCRDSKDHFLVYSCHSENSFFTFLGRFSKSLSACFTCGTRILLCFSMLAGEINWKLELLTAPGKTFRATAEILPVAHSILPECCSIPQPHIAVYSSLQKKNSIAGLD